MGQWLSPSANSAVIGALKMAEDSDDTIIRAVELDGKTDQLVLNGSAIVMPPRGIVTARVQGAVITASDGLES